MAHTLYRRLHCPECGHLLEDCRTGSWHVDTRICGPTAAVTRWREQNKKPPEGIVLAAVRREDQPSAANPTLASAPDWVKAKYGID